MNRQTIAAALLFMASVASTSALAHDEKRAGEHGKREYARAEETAFGKAADPARAKREVRVDMSDTMRFSPSEIIVRRGETIRFVASNGGKLMHEMVLGTRKELENHAQLMRKFPEMEHDEPNMLHVAPGKSGEMGWQFTKSGDFYYGCLVPGHFEAGMVGKVIVR